MFSIPNVAVVIMDLPVTDENSYSSVADFYAGKSIFLTGCTRFLGKLLVEKLLWSCLGIEKIYVLIRSKNNADTESRLTTMLNTEVSTLIPLYTTYLMLLFSCQNLDIT